MDTARLRASINRDESRTQTSSLIDVRDDLRSTADSLRDIMKDQQAVRVRDNNPARERAISRLAQSLIDVRNALYEIDQALDCI